MQTVTIRKGSFEDATINDVSFKLIKDYHPYKAGGGFFLVDGRSADAGEFPAKPIRIKVKAPSDAELSDLTDDRGLQVAHHLLPQLELIN